VPRILVIDNYDSFTYNLVQYLAELGAEVTTWRNDAASIADVERLAPDAMLVSPGPGTPDEAGNILELIGHFAGKLPILGVCLGHQAIAQVYGGRVIRADRLMHGRTSPVEHDGRGVFQGLPTPFTAARYHSLIVEESTLPAELYATSHTPEGELMGLRHRDLQLEGVQFHPESFLSEHGHALLKNFLAQTRAPRPAS
jgi:anthranilate synthase/aminodeoxychorismate synthase-like glutamine amidotransferase